jgi:[histone H3]-lysine36 N-dimethyltransferase SETMAR
MQVIFTASPPPPNRSGQYGRSKWRYVTSSAPPHTGNQGSSHTHSMTRAHDFVVDLAKAGKSFREIQDMVSIVYGDKSLKKSAIYNIMKKVKEGKNAEDLRGINTPKRVRSADVIASVSAAVAADRRVTVRELASNLGLSIGTIDRILHKELGLVKKSARWVPKLLSPEQKLERVRTSTSFVELIQEKGASVLDRIITMDESAVSMHTPTTKQQSKQWLKKGTPGPVKARVHATRTKTMVLAFFDSKGMVYNNYVPKGQTVNKEYVIKALQEFLRKLRKKRPELVDGEWFLHWDNARVHSAKAVQDYLTKRGVKVIEHPPYSPDLAPADFFLFPTLKKELAGITLAPGDFRKEWGRLLKTIPKEDFAKAFVRWQEHCEKCVRIGGSYVEKS